MIVTPVGTWIFTCSSFGGLCFVVLAFLGDVAVHIVLLVVTFGHAVVNCFGGVVCWFVVPQLGANFTV